MREAALIPLQIRKLRYIGFDQFVKNYKATRERRELRKLKVWMNIR